ncbi:MAG: energy transducer TonB [Bacteroidetes bacterium]|nr:energy transducer TonB [Bacteroidota bacterium]
MALRKSTKADLKSGYRVVTLVGMVLSLLLLIALTNAPLRASEPDPIIMTNQEVVQIEEIQQTKQQETPPPPPKPPVPVEVPNDEILENDELDLDASLDIDEPIADLPPPPPAEEPEEPEPAFFVVVEDPPELIGGMEALHKKINYPPIAKKAGVEGRVTVQFIVNEQGNVQDAVVLRGIGAGCDEEALRAITSMKFKPGKQRGKPVKVKMSLPVMFKLK